jgi:hypothetical protein
LATFISIRSSEVFEAAGMKEELDSRDVPHHRVAR